MKASESRVEKVEIIHQRENRWRFNEVNQAMLTGSLFHMPGIRHSGR